MIHKVNPIMLWVGGFPAPPLENFLHEGEVLEVSNWVYCQNPNLTTTQTQPKLNLVGFDTIITLHPPLPHPTTTGTLLLPKIIILGV